MENTGAFFVTVAYPADKVNLKVNPKLFVSDKVFVIFGLGAGLSITAIFVYTYYAERFHHFCTMLTLFITLFFHEHQKIQIFVMKYYRFKIKICCLLL